MKDRLNDSQKKLPHGAVPTNVRGVYALPPLPAGFDANTASPAALLRNGMWWKRPEENDHPGLVAAWRGAFSRPWERIIPRMEAGGKRRHSKRSHPRVTDTPSTTHGGVVCFNPFAEIVTTVGVSGQWTVPVVTKPSGSIPTPTGSIANLPDASGWDSSSWIGLGGFETDPTHVNLLQAGVQHYVLQNGNAVYVAFYQWLVAGADSNVYPYVNQTNTSLVVRPGDTILGNVQYDGHFGNVSLGNLTTGQGFSMLLDPPNGAPFAGGSAEWIVECPDGGPPTAYLPNFTPVTFNSAITCGGQSDPVEPSSGQTMTLIQAPFNNTTVQKGFLTATIAQQ